jgi:hypothetical protein
MSKFSLHKTWILATRERSWSSVSKDADQQAFRTV